MKLSLCYSQPSHVCFPWFHEFLKRNKSRFSVIYCSFTNENQPENYRNFIEKDLPFVTFINIPKKDEEKKLDWRDEAVTNIIEVAQHNNDFTHYCFIEQDFLTTDKLWDTVTADERDFIYYDEGGRIHPGFAIVTRSIVQGTSKDFSANPPYYDHFGKFFQEVKVKTPGTELRELGLLEREDYLHSGGLTQNYYLATIGGPFYKGEDFLAYNYHSLYLPNQNTEWRKVEASIVDKYGKGNSEGWIKKFFS